LKLPCTALDETNNCAILPTQPSQVDLPILILAFRMKI
jgi:hypothetical protein